jgi:hypothetical protein
MTKTNEVLCLITEAVVLMGSAVRNTGVITKKLAPPTTARGLAKNQCGTLAYTSYLNAKIALDQQQGSAPIQSIDQVIARRRRQEQFCLQFATCMLPEISAEARALTLESDFGSCLRGEALEEYDAVPRDN